MKNIKTLIFTFILSGTHSIASEKAPSRLNCSIGHHGFSAELDTDSHSRITMNKADLKAGFAIADNLKCSSQISLDEPISCVGHWFNSRHYIVEVAVKKSENGEVSATVHNWKSPRRGKGIAEGAMFDCVLE